MAFDKTQPTDTTKIRNLGTVIRPNWAAIQEAQSSFQPTAINFANRTPLPISNNPAAIATAYLLYCREDSAGNPELFGIDSSSNITQFTKGAITAANAGSTFIPGGIILKWARNVTVSNGVQHNFNSDTSDFPNTCYAVYITPCPADTNPATVDDFAYVQLAPAFNGFTCTTCQRTSTALIPSCRISYLAIGN